MSAAIRTFTAASLVGISVRHTSRLADQPTCENELA
jgi:hypothetical protein